MRDKLFRLFLHLFGFSISKKQNSKKGTIIILIDGLSFDALQLAITRRKCPTIKKLLKKDYSLQQYYCGLPASTTATEALLMYGNKSNIPGFTWLDRTMGEFVRGNRSYELSRFEDSYQKKRNLLENGSSIMSVYTGGATELSISGRSLSLSRSLIMMKAIHYLLMTILYPIQLLRAITISGKMLLLYSRTNPHIARETMATLILGQFSCFLTEVEIMRNTQRIFVDFLLYDEFAHEYGPTHPTALSSLRSIDRYIKRISTTAKNSGQTYDVIIISDHGQTASIPYDLHSSRSETEITNAIQDKTRVVQKTYGGFIPDPKQKKLYVLPAGSTLQLYFSESLKKPFSREEIELLYPRIIEHLLSYHGFGWVLVREKNGSRSLIGKHGSIQFDKNGKYSIKQKPFEGIPDADLNNTIQSFNEYSTFENNGDIVIFGSVFGDHVVSFEKHKGTHGGFFGPMVYPFIISTLKLEKDQPMEKIFQKIEYNMR